MKKIVACFLFFILSFHSFTQEKNKLTPYKIGVLFNNGTNENFVFDDPDYTLKTKSYKAQAFYKLGNWKNLDFELIVQPQIQFSKHQLINEQYVLPSEDNYLEKREEFTQLKKMHLFGVEFGFATKKEITKKLDLQATISLGFMTINKRSERLAKGFTFIENFSLGLSYEAFKDSFFYLGSNFGHTSNLNFQLPNDGYNILGLEIGYSILLK